MLKVDLKTANLATLLNFDVIEKIGFRIGISDPNFIFYISDKVYFYC